MCDVNRPTVLLCLEVPLLALPGASVAVAAVAAGKTYFTVKTVPSAEAGKKSPLPAGALDSAA